MSRIDWIEQRLREWAQWLVVGDGSGYSTKNTLHPEWSPPSPGTTPTMKVAPASHAPETHRAVRMLSERLQHTLQLHYTTQLSVADQALRLGCQEDTVHARVWAAHRALARMLETTHGPFTE